MRLDKKFFFDLERRLKDTGLDSDAESFDAIKKKIQSPGKTGADDFAKQAVYVILAGGFSQKTAKAVHQKIMEHVQHDTSFDSLIKIFNNRNKINAIIKIWENRHHYCDGYYNLSDIESKLSYLSNLPHIGKITAHHLARNLGENVVKYDIWIQRLGVAFSGADELRPKIDNKNLAPEIKKACDDMFAHLEHETGLPRGYIDVVLWKACQNHMIDGV
ncbi:MAG: hypothetical protein FWG80_02395 [Alphaproteobacteria bacterium]|nr:hypothetical protein [Alphaproteobacteria bacterium]